MKRCGNGLRKCCSKYKLLIIILVLLIITIIAAIVVWVTLRKPKIETLVKSKPEINDFRLPSSLTPLRYYVSVRPYLTPDDCHFEGNVEIIMECQEKTDLVVLHSHNLSIVEGSIELQNLKEGSILKLYDVQYKTEFDFLILQFRENLRNGYQYRLSVSFSGKLRTDFKGFHISSYLERNVSHMVALTHFEPFHARKTFPCFDEPALKANFDVTIIRWKNMTSLSNMPKLKTIVWDDDWEADIFDTSVKMSTYSLSFFVGRYVSSRNNKITVWYPPKHSNYLITALNFAPKFLKFYEDVLKIPYTLPKLDLVSADWPHRAMENWGLIICSEKLIYSEKFSSGYRQRIIAKILAHETAHQWFGNLVTPKWWNDIWLSEGLSTYMEHVATSAFFPQWNKVDKTLVLAAKELYPRDCLDEVSAVSKSYNLENSLLEESFDVFTYIKGAVVTRMTRHIFGDDVFWKALSIYLKENSFKNVEEKDFWNYFIKESKHVLSKGGKLDLTESLSTWTKLKGMPIVTANTNYTEGTVFLSQISCRAKTSTEHKRDLWHIPISYATSLSPNFQNNSSNIKYWLTTVNATMENVFMSKSGWLLLNDRSQGYFVVNYDSRNWKLLAKQLKKDNKVFTPDQRFKLLADVAILLDLNYLDWDLSLDVYSYIGNENELSVLQFGVFDRLQKSTELIKHNEYEDVWNEFLIYILRPIYDKVGWKYQPLIDLDEIRDIDYKVVQQLCDIGYEPCVNEALRRFHLWKTNNKNGGEALYEDTVLCMGIKYGTQETWEEFYDEAEDEEAILSALTCSEEPENIQRLLEMVYEENDITKFVTVVQGILRNSKLWFAYYDFLDENFVDFVENHVRYQFLLSIKDETEAYNPVKYDKLISTCKKNIGTSKKLRAKARTLLKYDDNTVSRMNNMLDKTIHWLKNKSWIEKN